MSAVSVTKTPRRKRSLFVKLTEGGTRVTILIKGVPHGDEARPNCRLLNWAANGFYLAMDAVVGAFFIVNSSSSRLLRAMYHPIDIESSLASGGDQVERALPAKHNDDVSSLRHYTLAKQEVAASVRAAKQLFEALGAREAAERCQALVVQLAEDRFNLAVVGQFKRGKSSLMNAILGRELLPTGLLPLTSAITTLCYGSKQRVMLQRQGFAWEQEVPLAQLEAYITERGNPGNEKGLVEARVELPLPFLRHGLHFIDTPGIGSARHENTATTYAFLPHMNAVIFVTSVEAPLSEAEESFLLDIRGQVRQLFLVVNKIDMLDPTGREEVLGYIHTRVEQLLGTGNAHLSPLSARDGLIAKLNRDDTGMQSSGLAAFEQTLTAFLAEEQGRTFLVSVLDHALRLLNETARLFAAPVTGGEMETHARALELRQTMDSLRASLLAAGPLSAVRASTEPTVADLAVIDQAIDTSRSLAREPGGGQGKARIRTCPICAEQAEALFTFFAKWQYRIATDATAQRAFAANHGLCPVHTWQFQEMASPQGLSDGYALLIETMAGELSRLIEQGAEQAAAPLDALLASTATCPACRLVRETAGEQVEQLLALLTRAEGRQEYSSSAGLCLPHLQATLTHVEHGSDGIKQGSEIAGFLLREQVQRLENLAEDLRSYALKRDALRRGLLRQEEEYAWWHALVQLVGERAARGGAMIVDQGTV
jgi:GTP-binding protein EngB required for normal cell division